MAIVSEDKPLGIVLEASRAAADAGVKSGMRYSAALVLAPRLQASAVAQQETAGAVNDIGKRLQDFTPFVEPAALDPGVFWVDASGITALFHDHRTWVHGVCDALEKMGYRARVAVGKTRFGTYAAAKIGKRNIIFRNIEEESRFTGSVPLGALPLLPQDYELLINLGIRTVQDFLALSEGSIARRFGDDVAGMHRFAANVASLPVQFLETEERLSGYRKFDSPVRSKTVLGSAAESLLRALVEEAIRQRELVTRVDMRLVLSESAGAFAKADTRQVVAAPDTSRATAASGGDASVYIESTLKPAAPTGDVRLLIRLLHLRIENLDIPMPVAELTFAVTHERPSLAQTEIFERPPERNLTSGNHALALIRAELGDDSVRVAHVRPEHLPDRSFSWELLGRLNRVGPAAPATNEAHHPLVPVRLFQNGDRRESDAFPGPDGLPTSDGALDADFRSKSGIRRQGRAGQDIPPSESIVLSGSWWEDPYDREYRYIRTDNDAVLWLYYDRQRGTWVQQGSVN